MEEMFEQDKLLIANIICNLEDYQNTLNNFGFNINAMVVKYSIDCIKNEGLDVCDFGIRKAMDHSTISDFLLTLHKIQSIIYSTSS